MLNIFFLRAAWIVKPEVGGDVKIAFFIAVGFLLFSKSINSSENVPSIINTITNETERIEKVEGNFNLIVAYIDRGESYLAAGQFKEAIEDFKKGSELCWDISNLQMPLKLRSLFGLMIAYVCLGEESNAFYISEYLNYLINECNCHANEISLCKDEDYVIGPEREPYNGWCEETVNSVGAALKGIVRAAKFNLAVKESLIFSIDKFAKLGLQCCSRGGLWKSCVGPLARKLHEWKVLGIPADPAWD